MAMNYLEKIIKSRVYDAVKATPLIKAESLSNQLGYNIWLKREDLHPVFSFKLRGAYNKLAGLPPNTPGVIAVSAGNHAWALAWAAQKLKINATLVMPRTTPCIRVEAVSSCGAEVILHGDNLNEAMNKARSLERKLGYTFIHPFDDPDVIAGNGTIGLELIHQPQAIDAIFVPVGGGGLIAGIAAIVKAIRPNIKIIGVETLGSACLYQALEQGKPVTLSGIDMFSDGTAVDRVGDVPFQICSEHVDEMILVDGDEVCAAVRDFFLETRCVVEPAGALALAGLKKYMPNNPGKLTNPVAIISGANTTFQRMRYIAERAELGAGKEVLFALEVPDYPGSIADFCRNLIHYNITEFSYRYSGSPAVEVYLGLALENEDSRFKLVAALEEKGYRVVDLSHNEVAKVFVRYMIGGVPMDDVPERIVRFWFPERKRALLNFLATAGGRFYLTMLHYRNHGCTYGEALAGFRVPHGEQDEFKEFLNTLETRFKDETDNPACKLFLARLGASVRQSQT